MGKLFGGLGAILGGWVGWWLGTKVNFATGFFLSIVGTGAGLYLARRWVRDYLS
jgi:hypothetical protein